MPNQLDDRQLLRQYVHDRSAEAFEQIVRRYAGIVLASARRQVGNTDLAEDVTQAVFIVLTKKAPSLVNLPTLGGWLMKVARYAAIDAIRKQQRQRRHERAAANQRPELQNAGEATGGEWAQLSGVLDDAIARLGSTDRDALVLRYFQDQSYSTIASKLGMNEEAARKRIDRALEKLRGMLSRRGIAVPASAIVAGVSANASASVSPALLGAIITGAPIGVSALGLGISIAKGAINMMTWAKATAVSAAIAAIVIVAGGTVGITYFVAQSNGTPHPATAPAGVATADDRLAIQGTWYYVSVTQKGGVQQKLPGAPGEARTVITDVEVIQEFPGGPPHRTRYTIDPAKKWIDLQQANGSVPGLYELNGDTLIICGPESINIPRPEKIGDGSNLTVMTLSRNKPSTTAPSVASQETPAVMAAKADLSNLETAFDAFEIDTRRYPTSEEGLAALLIPPLSITAWRGPYIRQIPVDPWGHSYSYQYPGKHRPAGPEIWSAGPDGKDGTADDITSWSK